MLARPSNPYKYYFPKVLVVTYLDDICLPELAFSHVRSSKIFEISPVGRISSTIMVSINIEMKNC